MTGIILIIIGYLLGSLSSAIIVCRLMKLPDPRQEGSGNPGTMNVLRIAGLNPAIFTLLGDVLKGLIAVLLARAFGVHGFMLSLVALAAFIGHIFPVFFKFEGGKGVATAIGAILGLSLWAGLITIVAWIVVLAIFRYASLASLVALVVAPICALFAHAGFFIPLVIMLLIVVWRHWGNIQRLMDGTEDKVDFNKLKGSKTS